MFAAFILVLFYRYDRVTASLWIRYPGILLDEGLQLASVCLQIILWLRNANKGVHPCATTCPTALNPASLPGWAPVLPHIPRLWTSPPYLDGLRFCHVSYGFGPRLPAETGSGTVTCPMAPDLTNLPRRALALPHVLWLWALPPYRGGLWYNQVSHGSGPHLPTEEGSGAATHPTVPCGSQASSINKCLAGLAMRLGSHVPKACSCVSKAPTLVQLWPA
jgi:hypothetical protein